MAWDDPSPRARSAGVPPSSQPGYGEPDVRLSFMTIVARAAAALFVCAIVHEGVRACVLAWQSGRGGVPHPVLAVALPLLVAVLVGWLVLRHLLKRPATVGLSDRIRNGGGWLGGRRSWDDGYGDPTFGDVVVADAVGDVIGAAIDAAID